jgi:hypothetical protein
MAPPANSERLKRRLQTRSLYQEICALLQIERGDLRRRADLLRLLLEYREGEQHQP